MDVQQNILRKMLKKWQDVSTLTMREETDPSVSDDDVEILISFVRLYHGDPYEFDGQGGTLAHAYYPHSNRGLAIKVPFVLAISKENNVRSNLP